MTLGLFEKIDKELLKDKIVSAYHFIIIFEFEQYRVWHREHFLFSIVKSVSRRYGRSSFVSSTTCPVISMQRIVPFIRSEPNYISEDCGFERWCIFPCLHGPNVSSLGGVSYSDSPVFCASRELLRMEIIKLAFIVWYFWSDLLHVENAWALANSHDLKDKVDDRSHFSSKPISK